MHSQPSVDLNGKSEIVNLYNTTEADVDAFDQMCGAYSLSRRTGDGHFAFFIAL